MNQAQRRGFRFFGTVLRVATGFGGPGVLALVLALAAQATGAADGPGPMLTEAEAAWLESNASTTELWFNPEFPPLEFESGAGEFVGMGGDVIALVESRLGVTFRKRVCGDWCEHLAGLEDGRCAIAPTIVQTASRDRFAFFTSPYARVPVVIIGTASLGQHCSLPGLRGRRVAVVKGFATEEYLREQAAWGFEVVPVFNVEEGLRQVAFGQVDAYVENLAVASYYITRNGISNLQICGITDYEFVFRIGVSRKYPLLHSAIQKALNEVRQDELRAVQEKWISLKPESGMSRETLRLLLVAGAFSLLLILGLSLITAILKMRLKARIADLRTANEETEESRTRYRELFYQAPIPLVEFTLEGEVTRLNDAATAALGYRIEDMSTIENCFKKIYPDPAYREQVRSDWARDVAEIGGGEGRIGPREYRLHCKDGSSKVFLLGASITEGGGVVSLVDIDERKRVEMELVASRERFSALFDMAPFSCVITDFEGRYLRVNQHFCERTGRAAEELVGCTSKGIGRQMDEEESARIVEELRRTGRCPLTEMTFYEQGHRVTSMFASRVIDWQDGKAVLSATVDITERKEGEERLRLSEERFSKVFELAPDIIVITRMEDGLILDANRGFQEITGWEKSEVLGRLTADLGLWSAPSDRAEMVEALAAHGEALHREIQFRCKDGAVRTGVYSARAILLSGEPHVLFVMQDISEKKAADERLRREKESLRVTLDCIGDAVIATDTEGRITRMNPVAAKLTGWPAQEAMGQPLDKVFQIIDADSRGQSLSPFTQVLDSGNVVSSAGGTVLVARDGSEYRIANSGAAIRSDDGSLIGVVLVFRDMTQEHAIQEQLRHSQKMEAVGLLAGGVAHDFNNMLGAILGYAELLGDSVPKASEERSFLNAISDAASRAADLTQKLLLFSRKGELKLCPIDIHRPIRDAVGLLERTIDPRIDLEMSLSRDPIEVKGDRSLIQNAVLNILINATHAMPDGGALKVASRRIVLEEAACKMTGFPIAPGPYVLIEVQDTGCGISREYLTRIFDPFFTTKEFGKGTGLGLAAVFGTVQQHEGAITVHSDPGKGTCFRILLPTTDEALAREEGADEELVGGSGRILLVDDEPTIREVGGKMLANLGYDVTLASDGKQAAELFGAEGGDFDLVILDMIMPVMNGRDCFYALREMRGDVRVVLASGFTRDEDLNRLWEDGLRGFIRKPFRSADLDKAVREAFLA